jgi:hypothetical protein
MKKSIIILIVLAIIVVVGVLFYQEAKAPTTDTNVASSTPPTDFASCSEAGGQILESYPAVCVSADGAHFTEDIGNALDKTDLITVDSPRPNDTIKSPLTITGKARGNWYFEASFPVKLTDADGNVLASAPAQAKGDWMTTEFVPFTVTLTFATPTSATGTLNLLKDNPSGLPEKDDALYIPVNF